jgi:TonB family protein
VQLIDFPDAVDLAFDETELPDDGRSEPLFPAVPRSVDEPEPIRLDSARTDFDFDPAPPLKRPFWRGPAGSLLLHLLPLLVLIGWPKSPMDVSPPIPIQLVIEQPQPPPPPAPKPAPQKPAPKLVSGLRASDDFGQPKGEHGPDLPPPTLGEPQPSAAAESGMAAPDEPAADAPQSTPAETPMAPAPKLPPKPTPPKQQAAVQMPKPEGGAWPLPLSADQPRQASHAGRIPGPNATRDEYCAYVLSLTMSHIGLLPLSLLGARHGDTYVAMRVLQDGTIAGVRVTRGSGYTDIDERVAQMVVAVGRFPPLPQWIPGPAMEFTFHLHFPHPAEQ